VKQLVLVLVLAAAGAAIAAMTSPAPAGPVLAMAFPCPKNASTPGPQNWVRNYPNPKRAADARGATWCNDGATVTTNLAGVTKFLGGVCTRDSSGRHVSVGTRISINDDRVAKDPAGFHLTDHSTSFTKRTDIGDLLTIGKGKLAWDADSLKVKWPAGSVSGTFSGIDEEFQAGDHEVEKKVAGSFRCKRIVKAGL
jgi:hypothetical protein